MRKLLNTLYITTENHSLYLRNNNVCIAYNRKEIATIPTIQIECVVCIGNISITSPLMEFLVNNNISIVFLTSNNKFMCKVNGKTRGNVLMRLSQYNLFANSTEVKKELACDIIMSKLRNSRYVLQRTEREKGNINLAEPIQQIKNISKQVALANNIDTIRGLEGISAKIYFEHFDDMLSCNWCSFKTRTKRPPENEVNASLSFCYSLLKNIEVSALESFGLDPYIGFMHTIKPGRPSLALDMMEELRSPLCDRFVCSLFNTKQLDYHDFSKEGIGVYLNEKGRKTIIGAWQKRLNDEIMHPFINEKIPIGLIPYTQAQLLARYLRGDSDGYPPFFWR